MLCAAAYSAAAVVSLLGYGQTSVQQAFVVVGVATHVAPPPRSGSRWTSRASCTRRKEWQQGGEVILLSILSFVAEGVPLSAKL